MPIFAYVRQIRCKDNMEAHISIHPPASYRPRTVLMTRAEELLGAASIVARRPDWHSRSVCPHQAHPVGRHHCLLLAACSTALLVARPSGKDTAAACILW